MNPIFSYRFEIGRKASPQDVLLVFAATPTLDSETFATIIENEIEQNLVPDQIVLVVREPSFMETSQDLAENSQHLATLARLGDRAGVTLIGYDHMGAEISRKLICGPTPKRDIKFVDFKRRACNSIFSVRHGFVESTSTYHFENPSGRHTERFIRLSNILVRGAEIAFIAFCTLPYVPKEALIAYIDTPSLYAIVSAINDQRLSFGGLKPVLSDNFSSYAGIAEYVFTNLADSFVLISASSSGSLATKLMKRHPFASNQITHLLFLGKDQSKSNIVCDLGYDPRHNADGVTVLPSVEEPDDCKMCKSGSHAIKLQGDQFEFAGPQQEALLIGKDDAPSGLAMTMDRFSGGALFSVGLSKVAGRLPRQFNIDPEALLSHSKFQDRFAYVLRRSIPASLSYVVAVDDISVRFANQIAHTTPSKAQVIARDKLDQISVNTDSAIAIAAVIIESGRSLLDISRDLRSIAPNAPILYLAGFSKTTGEPRRETLEKTLVQTVNPYPYQMIEVERMILPLSSEYNPWAAELTLLIDPSKPSSCDTGTYRTASTNIPSTRR